MQAGKRNIALGSEQAVHLGAAGLQQRRHFILGDFLLLYGLIELPRHHFVDRLGLRLFGLRTFRPSYLPLSNRNDDLSWKPQPVLESRHDMEPKKATMQMLA